jgi:glyoxylase-like metal-dependent hydrolase (beta-lactamase superfamily II)
MSTDAGGDPLKDWLASLEKFRFLHPDTLVLPAHNRPFFGIHQRLSQLASFHEKVFRTVSEACSEPKTVLELMPVIFKRELDATQAMLALGECMAHLNYMTERQMLEMTTDEKGVNYYVTSLEEGDETFTFHE